MGGGEGEGCVEEGEGLAVPAPLDMYLRGSAGGKGQSGVEDLKGGRRGKGLPCT
jgi:hypothetical protein